MPDIVGSLPSVVSWNTDDMLILAKRPHRDSSAIRYLFDFKTRREMPYQAPATATGSFRGKRVQLKNNDLYFINGSEEVRLTHDEALEINPTFSPDSNWVAYTKNNNLYAVEINTKKETQFTFDGSDSLMNGYASWVYMEEILGRPSRYRAFWWSPDSKSIAFFRSDDSGVPVFTITEAGNPNKVQENWNISSGDDQHGYVEKLRYPKAGDKNPEVKVGIAQIGSADITWADFNEKDDQYFGMPYWTPGGDLLALWVNRDQNDFRMYRINLASGKKELWYEETQKTWVDMNDTKRMSFLQNGNSIMLSDKTGWRQMYLHDKNGKLINPITKGEFTVTGIEYIDEKNKTVYFTARGIENTARVDFYSVKFDGSALKRLTFGDYNHRIRLSPNAKYFITTYSNANTPTKMTLLTTTGKKIADLGDSRGSEFGDYQLAKTELIRVKSEDGKFDLPAMVTWPLNMEAGKKYPVLVSIYGGPDAGTVWDNWNFSPLQQWYAKEGLIQIAMDHRASGHFGKQGVDYMHRNLGYWEMKDYSTIVKDLIANHQADADKICITGFSYGGYLSCYAVTYGSNVFKYGMAGGAVTDWSLYDSHYTEKFMGTPQNNPEGYKSGSVFTWVDKYKGGLQLVHGEIDENVHLQNSMKLAGLLQDQKKDFEFMIYPSGRHGWGGNRGLHFQNLKTRFIYRNLLEKEVPQEILR